MLAVSELIGRLIGMLVLVAATLVLIKVIAWAGEGVFWGGACT